MRFLRIIPALGIAQVISWGTLYYSIAVLASPIQRSLHISPTWLFGAFTAGLLVSGAASALAGRLVDELGGRRVLATGSLLGALAFFTLGLAQDAATFFFGWILGGAAMAATLYDPAFATLHQLSREHYRRSVTALTIIAGFASTVFWPLTDWLEAAMGWRATFFTFSVLHLAVCFPLHWFGVPGTASRIPSEHAESAAPGVQFGSTVFYWLAASFAIAMFVMAVVFAHLIDMLKARGISSADAILIGALIGPMQVAARVIEFTLARRAKATRVGVVAFTLFAVSILMLAFAGRNVWWAIAFAVLFGASNGIMTIVRGTAPAELFGQRQIGSLLGRLARPAFFAKAIAPLIFAALLAQGMGASAAQAALAVVALAGLACFILALRAQRNL